MSVQKKIYSYLNSAGREILLSHSAYSADEIHATLERAEELDKDYRALIARASALLVGMSWLKGYDSEKHKALADLCNGDGNFPLQTSEGVHEMFPVKTWRVLIGKQERFNKRFEKAIVELESAGNE